ncbi:MAG TPA: hypothetical protein VFR36_08810 [Sphingomicrobium sp.]|nr:hypothetical protein [Sphingomicrobium sp.]
MKWTSLFALALFVAGCGGRQQDAEQITDLQSKSWIGPTAKWPLDPALSQSKVQEMRDRAYSYCLTEKPSDQDCLREQDDSLFQYASSFGLIRIFRAENEPTFPFAAGHQLDPSAFERVHRYCRSIYVDQGSRDARSLGPCMSAGIGADYFGIVPVP